MTAHPYSGYVAARELTWDQKFTVTDQVKHLFGYDYGRYKVEGGSGFYSTRRLVELTGTVTGAITTDLDGSPRKRLSMQLVRKAPKYINVDEGYKDADYGTAYYENGDAINYTELLKARGNEIIVWEKLEVSYSALQRSGLPLSYPSYSTGYQATGIFVITSCEVSYDDNLVTYNIEAADRTVKFEELPYKFEEPDNNYPDVLHGAFVSYPRLVFGGDPPTEPGYSWVSTPATGDNQLRSLGGAPTGIGMDTDKKLNGLKQKQAEDDAWNILSGYANKYGCRLFFDNWGRLTIENMDVKTHVKTWTYSEDNPNKNTILSISHRTTSDDVFSGVQLTGQSQDKDITATVWNTTKESATYHLGKFGKKLYRDDNKHADNLDELKAAAKRKLREVTQANDEVELEMLRNPWMNVGDLISLRFPMADIFKWTTYEVTSISIGLGFENMSVTARRYYV